MRSVLLSAADTLESVGTRLKRRSDRRRVVDTRSLADLELEGWADVRPVFVLSTGRCGTKLLSELIETAGGAAVHHAPRPELIRVSRRAFEEIDHTPELFAEVIKTAREELIHEATRYGKVFIETNNRVTFFAPVVRSVFPEARFVHLVRNPADIVRSGIRRGWYTGAHAHDLGRIHPLAGTPDAESWDSWDPIERIGWMWQQTNEFIERACSDIDDGAHMRIRAEDLFADPNAAAALLEFMGVPALDPQRIAAVTSRPVNAQRTGDFPTYADWTPQQQQMLRDRTPLASSYGYELEQQPLTSRG